MNFEAALLANYVGLILAKPGELNYIRMQKKCYCQLHLGYILVHCESITIMPQTNLFPMKSLNLTADNLRAVSLGWSRLLCTELDCFRVLSFDPAIN